MKSDNIAFLLLISVLLFASVCQAAGGLKNEFYQKTCPEAEQIIRYTTWNHVQKNTALPAKLLRMHFHDCFQNGCDGSILLNSTANVTAEKDAIPNLSLSGFDVIDEIKARLEIACPTTVSCADILALAARDSVAFQYQRDLWPVQTGRRDGIVSLASNVFANIPSPFSNFSTLVQNFKVKGLNVQDLVVLSGGHTIGVGHCNLFADRLYNFTGKGDADPSLDPGYAAFLKKRCKSDKDVVTVFEMDPRSSLSFDVDYFVILKKRMGLFVSDAALLTNKQSSQIVSQMTNPEIFLYEFSKSMLKMGKIGVLTGINGEIRKKCGIVN